MCGHSEQNSSLDPLLKKELLVASKDSSNIIVIDKTLPQGSNDLVILKLLKEICYLMKILLNFQIILL